MWWLVSISALWGLSQHSPQHPHTCVSKEAGLCGASRAPVLLLHPAGRVRSQAFSSRHSGGSPGPGPLVSSVPPMFPLGLRTGRRALFAITVLASLPERREQTEYRACSFLWKVGCQLASSEDSYLWRFRKRTVRFRNCTWNKREFDGVTSPEISVLALLFKYLPMYRFKCDLWFQAQRKARTLLLVVTMLVETENWKVLELLRLWT